jgi:uncharacterized damage-inducible protein DinB
MIAQLRRLVAHLAWADEHVLEGLRVDPGSDPAALSYFAHVVSTEHVWLSRIAQRPPDVAVWPTLSLDECAFLAARNRDELEAIVATLTEEADLAREIPYRNSAGVAFVSRLDDILIHVSLHGAYHRGQVSLMVRRSGGTPTPTDYIGFVRGVPAATTPRS